MHRRRVSWRNRFAGGWLFSEDRGHNWKGPFRFAGLANAPELHGMEITARADYLLSGVDDGLLFLSARVPNKSGTDRVFCARTRNGGRTFEFAGWVVSTNDPSRAVMPSSVRVGERQLVTAIRRRAMSEERNWIDTYTSHDEGATWRALSRVTDTGSANGNPPALLRLRDGRLCCAYGHRGRNQILARLSGDAGRTWSEPFVLRDGYRPDRFGDANDLGYPRLFQRADGRVVVLYYWSAPEGPEAIIAATMWSPPAP